MVERALLFCLLPAVLLLGCGEEGVAEDAVVRVYADAPLCGEAERVAAGSGVADLRVRVVCLPDAARGDRVDLAVVGGNARRATEDSAAVAYLAAPGSGLPFTREIAASAGIPVLAGEDGAASMRRLLDALAAADTSRSLREQLDRELG